MISYFKPALLATVTAGALAIGTSSSAADLVTFAQYTQIGTSANLGFAQSASKTGGTLATIGTPQVNFTFLESGLSERADFKFTATAPDGTPASMTGPSDFQQDGLSGSFSFLSRNAFDFNSTHYAAGSNLLSATFDDGSINSTATSGSASDSTLGGHLINFTSSVIDTSGFTAEDFSFSLTGARPSISAEAGQSLSNFTASSTGSFSSAAVPEPAAWALMLVGFGGMGAVLRRRHAQNRLAAV
jgi:hypothetical protein